MTPVLIVDDSLTVRMDLYEAFASGGFEPVPCPDAASARDALARRDFGLVVLDVGQGLAVAGAVTGLWAGDGPRGLRLTIGGATLLVDAAIVVTENAFRFMERRGVNPRRRATARRRATCRRRPPLRPRGIRSADRGDRAVAWPDPALVCDPARRPGTRPVARDGIGAAACHGAGRSIDARPIPLPRPDRYTARYSGEKRSELRLHPSALVLVTRRFARRLLDR